MLNIMEAKKSLFDARIDAGFRTQDDLAREAGVGRSTVWLAENGRIISYKSARLIVNALKSKGMDVEIATLDWVVGENNR